MHELTVVKSIVDFAEKEVSRNSASRVSLIEMDIGELSGIEMRALEFAWPIGTHNTVLEDSESKINRKMGLALCNDCGEEFEIHQLFDACPNCHSFSKEILDGKQMIIKKLILNT